MHVAAAHGQADAALARSAAPGTMWRQECNVTTYITGTGSVCDITHPRRHAQGNELAGAMLRCMADPAPGVAEGVP